MGPGSFQATKHTKEVLTMAVARITEIIGSSPKSWDDAVKNALERANKTLRGLTGIEVTKMNAAVGKGGKITEYRAHIRITFILEG
jgi:flavin-binding protein dodecin